MAAEGPLVVTADLMVDAEELRWRFSRASGPGGQGVNTTDSRVELSWTPEGSASVGRLPPALQERLTARLAGRLVQGALVVVASEHRAQLRNREAARDRLAAQLRHALAPPPPRRRATRPTRGSVERRLQGKRVRSGVKAGRRRGRDAGWS
ncbi:alternative ribosome rescue aminoacyl-tRNA hydrolase ArfB [Microlunatus capsulatus]|uniref:Ribosome-associated protein n=1 Tax=Microlunatus capsulatus TaxID=99117 RepID=A0ABS4ZB08_9ACTN|nr:alternative ribosome rescue aminoacyl-tRNA hydrolase ArfB [Microlunatus capsulatus]MBP2418248.1 ribosome-associated protein [Microlunatus capsulatus]